MAPAQLARLARLLLACTECCCVQAARRICLPLHLGCTPAACGMLPTVANRAPPCAQPLCSDPNHRAALRCVAGWRPGSRRCTGRAVISVFLPSGAGGDWV